MPAGLKRYQDQDHDHLITFSCYHQKPHFATPASRDLFEHSLEQTRRKYQFEVIAYVVMPGHVHLLVSEPQKQTKAKPLSTAMGALKLSVSKLSRPRPFWHVRYHDFNVITWPKRIEKLRYIHLNPVAAGLVESPEDRPHSSYLTYLHRQQRTVQIAL